MKGVQVDFIDDRDSKEIQIPELLPFKTGLKIRRKVNVSIETEKGKKAKATVKDGMGILTDSLEVIFDEVVKSKLSEEEQEVVDIGSLDRILKFYWPQVQSQIKKKA